MGRKIKAAVIGVGRMGRRHVQIVRDMGLSLVGVCDRSPEALELCKTEFHLSSDLVFDSAAEILAKTKPECVIIATTSPTHCEYTCLAAENGAKFILCEKPMAISLEQCDRMIETCRQYGANLAINHQMRFMEQYTEPKRIINSDAFGGLCSVTVVAGNFGLAMNGTHYFEMFRYITEEMPEIVTAWFSSEKVPNPRGPQFEDRAGSVRMITPKGKRFYLEVGADQGHGISVIYSGKSGQIFVDELQGTILLASRMAKDRALPSTRYGTPSEICEKHIHPTETTAPTRAVLEALLNNEDYPSGHDGRLAVTALVAAYCSDERGHVPVIINDKNLPVKQVFPWA
ncbi:MAG: Gfo/Idh/MocA family protein [Methanoregula sp.]